MNLFKKKPLFTTYAEDYLKAHKVSVRPTTACTYDWLYANRIKPFFSGVAMEGINSSLMQDFINSLAANGSSWHGIKDCAGLVKLIVKAFAAEQGKSMPVLDVKYPQRTQKPPVILGNDQYETLYNHCVRNPSARTLPTLIAMTTGLRIGEVCAIKYGDIDRGTHTINICKSVKRVQPQRELGRGYVEVSDPKTPASVRVVPVGDEVLGAIIIAQGDLSAEIYVSSGNPSLPLEPRSYRQKYIRLLASLGLPHYTFHALRHTFASRAIARGADVKTVSDILGHTNVEITLNTYTHSSTERKREVVESVTAGSHQRKA